MEDVGCVDDDADVKSISWCEAGEIGEDISSKRCSNKADHYREEELCKQEERVGSGLNLIKIGACSVTAIYRRKIDVCKRQYKN